MDGNPFKWKQSIDMGESPLTSGEIQTILTQLMEEWQGQGYDLTRRNCCHFAKTLCAALHVKQTFPGWINRLATAGAAIGDAGAAALAKAAEVDEKCRFTENAQMAFDKIKAFDEKHGLSQRAGELCGAAKDKVAALDAKYELDLAGKAAAAGEAMSSLFSGVSMGSMTEAAKAPK